MNFFAPAFLCDERAEGKFGLVNSNGCFSLGRRASEQERQFPVDGQTELQVKDQKSVPRAEDGEVSKVFISPKQARTVGWASVVIALLQSLCTAVLTISGIRVAIGLSALAAASGIYAPAKGWHQDGIRIPMLVLRHLAP